MTPFAGLREALVLPSARVLIAVNLGVIAAVVAWDWSVMDIVFLYWVENLVVGAINVARMLLARANPTVPPEVQRRLAATGQDRLLRTAGARATLGHAAKFFLIPFFIVHYGGFCYGHGVFVLAMFGEDGWLGGNGSGRVATFAELLTPELQLAIVMLAASHLFSFFRNYIAGGEYRRTNPAAMMMRPYGRIVALHLTILLGAALTALIGSPLGMLIVLVVLKTAADLGLHRAERRKLGTPMA